jgi:PKD repeat protein
MKKVSLTLVLFLLTVLYGHAQFLACEFTYNTNTPEPGLVGFSGPVNNYSPNTYFYVWSFGDGASANNVFPTHTYSQAGSYNVCLNIFYLIDSTMACNSCDTIVVSSGSPSCSFSANMDQSDFYSYYFIANVDTLNSQDCSWVIGGDTINDPNSTNGIIYYTFPAAGDYTVELLYYDAFGNLICNSNQIISVVANNNTICNITIDQLDAQSFAFYPPVNSLPAQSYTINFGDGSPQEVNSIGQFVHSFNPGQYNVCINAIYINGVTCNSCVSLTVLDSSQNCPFTYFPAPNGSLTYGFYAQVDTSNLETVTWIINGLTISPTVSSNIYTSYTFPGSGTYPVIMNYYNASGVLICSSTQSITITDVAENCDFIVMQNSNQNYTFSTAFIGQPANSYYSMNINGLALDTSYVGSFSYTLQPGNNVVCMTTTYLNGTPSCTSCQDVFVSLNPIDTLGCYVTAIPDPVNNYFYGFYLGAPNNLLWTITGPNGFTETITQYNSSQFFYTFPSDGVFNVSLTASDSSGNILCTNGYTITILGNPSNCNADFYAATSPLTGYFIDMSTGIDPQTTDYFWNFGDGGTSTERFPFHTYTSGGYYNVSLTIVNGNCIDTATQFVYIFDADTSIVVNDCNAFFVVTQTEPYSVNIVNLSSGNNLNFSWTFANGTTVNSPFPTLQVPFNTNFTFCLTVTNSSCFSTYCDSISFDSLGVIQRTSEMLNINVVSPQEITGYNLTSVKESKESIAAASYPNPFSENFTIDNANGKFNTYSIMTIDGREIVNGSLSKGIEVVQSNEWSNGVYFLRLNSQNGISNTSKIVKK